MPVLNNYINSCVARSHLKENQKFHQMPSVQTITSIKYQIYKNFFPYLSVSLKDFFFGSTRTILKWSDILLLLFQSLLLLRQRRKRKWIKIRYWFANSLGLYVRFTVAIHFVIIWTKNVFWIHQSQYRWHLILKGNHFLNIWDPFSQNDLTHFLIQ